MVPESAFRIPQSEFRLVVGLGNPGDRYAATRHNIGYRVIDLLQETSWSGPRLLKPESVFMNESGRPVAEVARKNGISPNAILVICDDFMIPLGSLRLRRKGSDGGHNGLGSILETLATDEVPRLRVGIGPVPEQVDPADFVLARFRSSEHEAVESAVQKAAEAVRVIVDHGFEAAMNRYNGKGGAAA